MDAETFLEWHDGGIGRLLGITFVEASASKVISQMRVRPGHFTRPDVLHGGILMAMADCTGAYGAVLNLPSADSATATIESKTNFLKKGRGDKLRAVSEPVHVGSTLSVWRTRLYRGVPEPIAEVTQTQMYLREAAAGVAGAEGRARQVPSAAGHAPAVPHEARTPAESYSKSIVDERERQIFAGACQVIAEKGFARATIREIAAAANMPVPTMYQYLERKEDLLYKIYQYFMTDLAKALEKWRDSNAPPSEKIEGAIRTMIDENDKNNKYIKIMFQETRSLTPEARKSIYELDGHYIRILKHLLDEGVHSGDIRMVNTELAANFIYFICVIWPLRYWTIGKFGQEEVTNQVIDFALRGLRSESADVSEGVSTT